VTNSGPFSRRPQGSAVPHGEVLGTYETYPEAQAVVDRLAKADFPVGQLSIIGNDLKTVEQVVRKRTWNRAALEGALSGAWFGLFLGLLFTLITPTFSWTLFAAAVLIGAVFGMFFRLATYAVSRRNRDFESSTQVLATNYQILVEQGLLGQAQDSLARSTGGTSEAPPVE
jgi:heat induced stress protein YflT